MIANVGNVGIIGNDSASNPVMELANISHSPNEDSADEGAQTEALDAVRGYELAVYNGNGARSESEADIGKFINCSSDSDDSGRTISDTKPTDSIPRPLLSRSGRLLKPTYKLLQWSNPTNAPAGESTFGSNNATLPSTRKRKDGTSVDKQNKQKAVKATLNHGPRGFLKRNGSQHNCLQCGVVTLMGQVLVLRLVSMSQVGQGWWWVMPVK